MFRMVTGGEWVGIMWRYVGQWVKGLFRIKLYIPWCAGWCFGKPGSRLCALCRGCYSTSFIIRGVGKDQWFHTSFHIKDAWSHKHQISLYVGCILVYIPHMLSLLFWVTAVHLCDINVMANFGRLSVVGHDRRVNEICHKIFSTCH